MTVSLSLAGTELLVPARIVREECVHGELAGLPLAVFGVGIAVSFIVALFVVRFFLGYVARHDLKPFAWYRIVVGVALLGLSAAGLLTM